MLFSAGEGLIKGYGSFDSVYLNGAEIRIRLLNCHWP